MNEQLRTSPSMAQPEDTAPGETPEAAPFDLHDLRPVPVPPMGAREKRAAWSLGAGGFAAWILLGSAVAVALPFVFVYVMALGWGALLGAS